MITRSGRIFGMMMLFGILVAVLAGSWEYAGPVTLAALIVGGFLGEGWDRLRQVPSPKR